MTGVQTCALPISQAQATLENTELNFTSGILANIAGIETNNWGTPGSNGGDFTLTGIHQEFSGDIVCDEISTAALCFTEGTHYTGAINSENTAKEITVTLDSESVWTLTGDSYITVLTNEDENLDNIQSGGYTIYYNADAEGNEWLDGQTIALSGGGQITPVK